MNRKPDPSKQTKDCKKGDEFHCFNMRETYSDMEGEQYRCEVCGAAYYLNYEDMK